MPWLHHLLKSWLPWQLQKSKPHCQRSEFVAPLLTVPAIARDGLACSRQRGHHNLGLGDASLHEQQCTTQSQHVQQCLQMLCAACHKADVVCIDKLTRATAGPASLHLEHGPPVAKQPINEAKQGDTQTALLSLTTAGIQP